MLKKTLIAGTVISGVISGIAVAVIQHETTAPDTSVRVQLPVTYTPDYPYPGNGGQVIYPEKGK